LVFVLFPMPPMGHELTLRPLRFAYFLAHFVFDLVRSAIEVGWWAIRPAPQPPSSVVAVKMSSRSDFFLTGPVILCTLLPRSVVAVMMSSRTDFSLAGTAILCTLSPGAVVV